MVATTVEKTDTLHETAEVEIETQTLDDILTEVDQEMLRFRVKDGQLECKHQHRGKHSLERLGINNKDWLLQNFQPFQLHPASTETTQSI